MAIQDVSAQSNRNHAVPQNIMDVEFKIIGDLTMRQFSYILIFGLMAYFNVQVMVGIFKWPLAIIFTILGLALAFIPVQDRGMDVWLVNFIKSVYRPTQMVWGKSIVLPTAFMYDNLNVLRQELITLALTSSRRKLEEFLDYSKRNLPLDPLDIPEAEYIKKVRDAFKDVTPVIDLQPQEVNLQTVSTLSSREDLTEDLSIETPIENAIETEIPSIATVTETPSTVVSVEPLVTSLQQPLTQEAPVKTSTIIKEAPTTPAIVEPTISIKKEVVTTAKVIKPIISKRILNTPTVRAPEVSKKIYSPVAPITPDRHSGRRFTSFLPSKGELVLPIRGERVLATSEQADMEEGLKVKTEKLQQLLSQIRQSNIKPTKKPEALRTANTLVTATVPSVVSNTLITPPSENVPPSLVDVTPLQQNTNSPEMVASFASSTTSENIANTSRESTLDNAKVALDTLNKKRNDLMNQLSSLKNANSAKYAGRIEELQKELQTINSNYQSIKSKILGLENKPMESSGSNTSNIKDASEVTASNVPVLNKPNILWGFVKDTTGKPISDIVVIIKNPRGEPVRATKTNELGQFILTTPLNNGRYIADISSAGKKNISFDTVSLEASGNVIPPIEFLGK